ncbi:putative acetyltransferase [Rivularia sp. PCC 7116]|uniref:GNAT family N-acetyltransferase n=1 Tax=Rivularia sp. PCC 7116 TaxID=373994 RepID=UPI00029F3A47|nr:GNAT family N-acetyltransferase [Rivularia sp. PCC 7116]AFY55831.1 putative acetyltransferase [Rivularia sp. PCC 7116]
MQIKIRNLQEVEIPEADRIFRLAFGTFIGLPNPLEIFGDADFITYRWKTDPSAAFAAEINGKLVGTNIACRWGNVGFFGPLSVHPDYWNQGVAQKLIAAVMSKFEQWDVKQANLFTFADSSKHHVLYQKFGFYPRFLTFFMAKSIQKTSEESASGYSQLQPELRRQSLDACFEITNEIYPGLDVSSEIIAVYEHNLGDTVLLWEDNQLIGFAVCHCGANTEAGSNDCYIKFAAVKPGINVAANFEKLLKSCEYFTENQGLNRLVAAVNISHEQAYKILFARQFRTESIGVTMHNPSPEYNKVDVFVLDNWR